MFCLRFLCNRRHFWITAGFALIVSATPSFGESTRVECFARTSERYALVIGNAQYGPRDSAFASLPKVALDRDDVAKALCTLGFTVAVAKDQDQSEMKDAIKTLKGKRASNFVVVYFSGHGMQQKGFNYLIPIGSHIQSSSDLDANAINLVDIYDALDVGPTAQSHEALIILDACRSNRFSDTGNVTPGLAIPSDAPVGITVAFATAPGTKALSELKVENIPTNHSPYTEFLLKYIYEPGLALPELFAAVRKDLIEVTDGHQIPWENSSALQSTFLAKPILAEWRTLDVADIIEVRIKGMPVLQDTFPDKWEITPTSILKPGRNPFEIRIYKDKTYPNNNQAFGREGWHYKLQLRIDGTQTYEFSCSESQPPRSRWGQVFTVYSGFIDVSTVNKPVKVSVPTCGYQTH